MFSIATRQASYRGDASQDRALVLRAAPKALVLAVASGVEPPQGGALAAQLTVETVELEGAALTRREPQVWSGLLKALDDALAEHPDAGQTGLAALCVTPQKITGASVGDAEAWWITDAGHFALTEAQKRKPFLGSGEAQPVPFALKLTHPGTLLLASDGLFKYADPLALTEAVRSAADAEAAAEALQLLAAPTGRFYDDLALVLVRVGTIAPWTRFLPRFKAD
jgi:PPM family protein phosphatase